jgi:cytochrome c biogenesis protein CcmG, thiol:disulfide interchange protein DsbE
MDSFPYRGGRRGRGRAPGLAVLLATSLAACADDLGPPGEPIPDPPRPVVAEGPEGERIVRSPGARERLILREILPPGRAARLLFLQGRSANPLPGGGAAWPDPEGDRVLIFDGQGRIERVLQGGGEGGASLDAPLAVVATGEGLRVEEREGGSVLFREGKGPERLSRQASRMTVGGGPDLALVARSVLSFSLAPVREGDPLLWRREGEGALIPVGRAVPSSNPMMGELANTGWAAASPDGRTVYFAHALRPEVRAFGGDGRLHWKAEWVPDRALPAPAFRVEGGTLRADFSLVQHALAVGPDGLVYLLAATRREGRADRLLVFDGEGALLRAAVVDGTGALFADPKGRVFALSLEEALARTPEADRAALAPFRLPALKEEGGWVELEALRGRVVVVNFWASWCPPCRREIPLLEELHRELGPEVVVVGLNEDVDPAAGRRFLRELGGVTYPNAAGRGALRSEYGYRGLPYTLILDRELRVARRFYGFGTSLDPIRNAVLEEVRGGAGSHP